MQLSVIFHVSESKSEDRSGQTRYSAFVNGPRSRPLNVFIFAHPHLDLPGFNESNGHWDPDWKLLE